MVTEVIKTKIEQLLEKFYHKCSHSSVLQVNFYGRTRLKLFDKRFFLANFRCWKWVSENFSPGYWGFSLKNQITTFLFVYRYWYRHGYLRKNSLHILCRDYLLFIYSQTESNSGKCLKTDFGTKHLMSYYVFMENFQLIRPVHRVRFVVSTCRIYM